MVINLDYLHVNKVYGSYPDFSTEPLDALLNTGNRVYVKTYNNIQGNRVLVNEYICYRLSKILDLPIPEAGIAIIDRDTEHLCDEDVFSPENYGHCFFSTRINKATVINSAIIPQISNKEDFYKIILFDHLIYNKDRNKGNLLVTSDSTVRLYIIDHTHVFKNACIWDKICFQQGMSVDDYLDRQIIEYNSLIYGYFWEHLPKNLDILLSHSTDFKNRLNLSVLEDVIKDLPDSWDVSCEDITSLLEYLSYRLEKLDHICNIIVGR
jgi:hypothetical protein